MLAGYSFYSPTIRPSGYANTDDPPSANKRVLTKILPSFGFRVIITTGKDIDVKRAIENRDTHDMLETTETSVSHTKVRL